MAKSPIGSREQAQRGAEALRRTTRCIYCNKVSTAGSRGQAGGPWCHDHRPGPRKKPVGFSLVPPEGYARKPPLPHMARRAVAFREAMIGKLLPAEMLAWPPCQRIMEKRPGERAECGLRHIAIGLIRDRLAPGFFQKTIAMLTDRGFLRPGDPPLPALESDGWSITVTDALL